jgi:hypothetical protein
MQPLQHCSFLFIGEIPIKTEKEMCSPPPFIYSQISMEADLENFQP